MSKEFGKKLTAAQVLVELGSGNCVEIVSDDNVSEVLQMVGDMITSDVAGDSVFTPNILPDINSTRMLIEIAKALENEAKPNSQHPTGSRLFGDATVDSDYDIVILELGMSSDDMVSKYSSLGYEPSCSEQYVALNGEPDKWAFMRNAENVNLIITNDKVKYDLWCKCDQVASELRLNREQRKVLYGIVIDGKQMLAGDL